MAKTDQVARSNLAGSNMILHRALKQRVDQYPNCIHGVKTVIEEITNNCRRSILQDYNQPISVKLIRYAKLPFVADMPKLSKYLAYRLQAMNIE